MDDTTTGPERPPQPPGERCLVCATDVLAAGGAITRHSLREGGRVLGWTCGDAHAAMVEAHRDARGRLRPRKTWGPPRRRATAQATPQGAER